MMLQGEQAASFFDPAAAGRWTGPIHPAESFVPAKTFLWGGEEDIVCGRLWNPSLISEVFRA